MSEKNERREFYDKMSALAEQANKDGLAIQEVIGIIELLLHGICWQEFETAKSRREENLKVEDGEDDDGDDPSSDMPKELDIQDTDIWRRMIR